uniref:Uncharacterized protein AlNc14C92G5721 n=1 Tax=Albugo laibachii Nc14 TaxID=890382 RepID=F0WGI7_9STRA|nr:conserved hypothetical protein [Albugo laibachii Nc14]|eukprot:CCA20351.1 conserved hypothetical protein [Albugo laibachii Nc14]
MKLFPFVVYIHSLPSVCGYNDFQLLQQPEVIQSECAQQVRIGHNARILSRTLIVNLDVVVSRFKSRLISFNTRSYSGRIPAPTIKICRGDTLIMRITNMLSEHEDANITNLHAHGLHVSPEWHFDNVLTKIASGETLEFVYTIAFEHPTGTFWYHPHHHGSVNTQITGLMAGALIVVDDEYHPLFPTQLAMMEDIVMVLQGICFINCTNNHDTIISALVNRYGNVEPRSSDFWTQVEVDPSISMIQDMTQVHLIVNGQYVPRLTLITGEFKRFRWINAISNNLVELISPECEMFAIASDGVYRNGPPLQKAVLVIPPGGRSDILIRCKQAGTYLISAESAASRVHLLGKVNDHRVASQPIVTLEVYDDIERMSTIVTELPLKLPFEYEHVVNLVDIPSAAIPEYNKYDYEFSMETIPDPSIPNKSKDIYSVNRKVFDEQYINHTMRVNEVQEWQISTRNYGTGCDPIQPSHLPCKRLVHPFHIHATNFQIVAKEKDFDPFDLLYEIGEWRDTIPIYYEAKILVRFMPKNHMIGRVLTHCHISSHSDQGMAQMTQVIT